jgi:CheY-like chemotaxis protein
MGGDLTVISQVGQGSKFSFDMPVKPGEVGEIRTRQPARRIIGLEPGQPVYRILIVEDRYENRTLLRKLLEGVGFEVREAVNGQAGVDLHASWQPQLIWMDMRMPVMDGYEATKRIKASTQGQATVVIALTASAFEEQRAVVLSAGCDDFVRKPFQESDIFEKMSKHLGVRYLYSEAQPTQSATPLKIKLTPSLFAALPPAWVADLHQAASGAQSKRVLDLLKQIEADHPALAETLTVLVNEFRFDEIMMLTALEVGE